MELEKTIKNGKAETKITGPLFPRLHVDDTKKAGPRAPPRNKMALYHEQLSILPQRFSNTTTSILPPPPVHGCILTNMSSSNQVSSSTNSIFMTHHLYMFLALYIHINNLYTNSIFYGI